MNKILAKFNIKIIGEKIIIVEMENNQTHSANHTDHPGAVQKHQDETSYGKKLSLFFHSTFGQDSVLIHLVFLKLLASTF